MFLVCIANLWFSIHAKSVEKPTFSLWSLNFIKSNYSSGSQFRWLSATWFSLFFFLSSIEVEKVCHSWLINGWDN
jgi:hypothetical protein